MKALSTSRKCCAVRFCVFLFILASAGYAANLNYFVTLNTATLVSNPNAPFSLDFQLETGSGNVTNSVTLSNFVFTGGTASGTPNFTSGGESGSFASTVTLTNTSANNEFAEQFATSVTQIKFLVSETSNSETVGTGTPIPDQFNVFIDDNNTADGFVPTTDTSGNNTLVSSAIAAGQTLTSVNTYSSKSPDAGVTAITSVPEPSSAAMFLLGVYGLFASRKRRSTY